MRPRAAAIVSWGLPFSTAPDRIVHVVSPYRGHGPLAGRQRLFFESIAAANKEGVTLLAYTASDWPEPDWQIHCPARDATAVGDASDKPFLFDLFDAAFVRAAPNDWLLYSNVDCCFAPDLYTHLGSLRGLVVEYMRQDVEGDPQSLSEVFSNPRTSQKHGLDAMAIRASYYSEIRPLLYNFVVGEPHWDTAYSALFRDRIPVYRDSERLFHPRHDQVWDLSHPTPAGRHNHQLFVDALLHCRAEKTMIEQTNTRSDTAVVIATFGNDALRASAHALALRNQLGQDLLTDIYVIELKFPGEASGIDAELRQQINYVPLPADDSHRDLFQKEAMWNYGWRHARALHDYDYYLFFDADVFSTDPGWHRAIRERLRQQPSRAVHCFDVVIDTEDPQYKMSSIAATFLCNRPNDLTVNPGIGWGLHRALLEMGNGFNPLSIGHCGDSLFVCEYLNTPQVQYDPYLQDYHWYSEVFRELPFRAEIDFVPFTLSHAYHGPVVRRDMKLLRVASDGLGPVHDWLRLDENGLQQWREPGGVQHRIIQQRARFDSEEGIAAVFAEFGYPRRGTRRKEEALPVRAKDLFAPPGWTPPPDPGSAAAQPAPVTTSNSFHVFDPAEIFRDNFPFSWCEGVVKRTDSTHLPMRLVDGHPSLVLDAAPGAPYFVAVLPVEANWAPQDLTGMEKLTFSFSMEGIATLALVSQAPDGTEASTRETAIPNTPGGQFSRSLSDWPSEPAFDIARVRVIRIIGHAGARLELRRILIT